MSRGESTRNLDAFTHLTQRPAELTFTVPTDSAVARLLSPRRRAVACSPPTQIMNIVHIHERRVGSMAGGSAGTLRHQQTWVCSAARWPSPPPWRPAGRRGTARRAAPGPAARAARPGARRPPLWREFTATPFTHPQIPYVGRAGYRGGSRPPPPPGRRRRPALRRRAGRLRRRRPRDQPCHRRCRRARRRHGTHAAAARTASTTSSGSATATSCCAARAAARTKLYATRNLTELIGVYGSRYGGDKSSWSWAGGLIWLCPEDRWTLPHRRHQGQGLALRGLDRQQARRVADADDGRTRATRGDRSITVDDPTAAEARRPRPAPPRRRRRPHPPGAHGGRRPGPRGVLLGRQDQADLVRPLRVARPHHRRARARGHPRTPAAAGRPPRVGPAPDHARRPR